jgi:hypothetical protein
MHKLRNTSMKETKCMLEFIFGNCIWAGAVFVEQNYILFHLIQFVAVE